MYGLGAYYAIERRKGFQPDAELAINVYTGKCPDGFVQEIIHNHGSRFYQECISNCRKSASS